MGVNDMLLHCWSSATALPRCYSYVGVAWWMCDVNQHGARQIPLFDSTIGKTLTVSYVTKQIIFGLVRKYARFSSFPALS